MNRPFFAIASLAALLAFHTGAADAPSHNVLTAEESAGGWMLLFDGKTTEGWRGFKKTSFPEKGWVVEGGVLKHVAGAGGGDIVRSEKFSEFELSWEWMIPPGANNGIKYFILEERGGAIGHEYQMIDDVATKSIPKHSTASFYDVLPPTIPGKSKPPGEWNHSRILSKGGKVEHWLNGVKVLEYTLGSPEVRAAVAKSKFKSVPGFGEQQNGLILLTDHHDEASYRNIKIRDLSKK